MTYGQTKTFARHAKNQETAAAEGFARQAEGGLRQPKGKWVYGFGDGRAEGKASMRNLLGGKGAGLAEMANLGLPVPPGFTITTEVCTYYYAQNEEYPKDLRAQVEKALAQVGRIAGKTFGDKSNPLLVSVRSGARASMPGMMDTVLNLGLNDETVEALAKKSGDRRFALTAIAASSPCIRMSCSASVMSISRNCSTVTKSSKATVSIPIFQPTIGRSWSRATRSA